MRPTLRRTGIGLLFAGLAFFTVTAFTKGNTSTAEAAVAAPSNEPSDRWLDGLTSKHKQLFDAPAPGGGIPLVHVMNYYDTYNKAYKVQDNDIDAVLTFYGATTFYGLNDAMWSKYRLGEYLETKDAKGVAVTANPWRSNPQILGMSLPQASVETLQKRGATFIVCNNALQIFSGMLAQSRGLNATEVYEDMKNNILPGVTLVPGMVIAIEQAHRAGLSYHRQ